MPFCPAWPRKSRPPSHASAGSPVSWMRRTRTRPRRRSVTLLRFTYSIARCNAPGTHRIIVRLLDLHAGSDVIWARRFDRELDDVLMLQGELAAEVAAQIDPELLLREGERRGAGEPGESTAFDLTLRAIPSIYRLEPSGFHAAGELLAAAVGHGARQCRGACLVGLLASFPGGPGLGKGSRWRDTACRRTGGAGCHTRSRRCPGLVAGRPRTGISSKRGPRKRVLCMSGRSR